MARPLPSASPIRGGWSAAPTASERKAAPTASTASAIGTRRRTSLALTTNMAAHSTACGRRAAMNAETRAARLDALRRRLAEDGCSLAAVAPTDNLRYLLGFAPTYDERACLLVVGGE